MQIVASRSKALIALLRNLAEVECKAQSPIDYVVELARLAEEHPEN